MIFIKKIILKTRFSFALNNKRDSLSEQDKNMKS